MKNPKVAKKSATGGRVSNKPAKALTAKSAVSTKASVKTQVKPAPSKPAAKIAKALPVAKSAPTKVVAPAKVAVPAKAAAPLKATAPAKAAPVKALQPKAETTVPEGTELKLAQKVPGTKLTVKVAAKMNGAPKKPPKKTRAQKLEELGIDKSNQLAQKWSGYYRKTQEVEAKPYTMREAYEAKTPILHKLLGWGYILSNKNDRLEVLFKDGIRFLISNYKA